MPEIEKAVASLVDAEYGSHAWYARPGHEKHVCKRPCSLPADHAAAKAELDAAHDRWIDVLGAALAYVDWQRVLLLARGRHRALEHWTGEDDDMAAEPCSRCITAAFMQDNFARYSLADDDWVAMGDYDSSAAYQRVVKAFRKEPRDE